MAKNLANDQIKELKEAFDLFDLNKNETISSKELRQVFKTLGIYLSDDEFDDILNELDKNGDGAIKFHEFARVMGSNFYQQRDKNDIIAAFKLCDKDHNGSISANELRSFLGKYRGNITRAQCQEIIYRLDKDGNGTINLAEFIEAFNQF